MLAQNFNRSTNVAMEHNVKALLSVAGIEKQKLNYAEKFI
jgi:hypothetical protein